MGTVFLALLLAVILGSFGFAVHVPWWIALAVLAVWLVGFLIRVSTSVDYPQQLPYAPEEIPPCRRRRKRRSHPATVYLSRSEARADA